ncbi:MAG TPA: ribonuclease HIII [Kiritimatiellia bacterium]|nr:ribonuclease HIII [Kiritimatiellia bacterium]
MPNQTSFTYVLNPDQQTALIDLLHSRSYRLYEAPHTRIAAETSDCRVVLYNSGKCLIQGKGAEDWVLYELEPNILKTATLGYEDVHNPEKFDPHMGIDESGKGDFFGPLVIAAVYIDPKIAEAFTAAKVRDSKTVTTDRAIAQLAQSIRAIVGNKFTLVEIGPAAYNRMYERNSNVNQILAWGHARAIENLLEIVPHCPRALADKFGPTHRIESALMQKGKSIQLEQRTKAESDPAVAAASILARDRFVQKLRMMSEKLGVEIPKGVSDRVKSTAVDLIKRNGPETLRDHCKLHFRTSREVLLAAGHDPASLGLSEKEPPRFTFRKKKDPAS